MKLFQKIRKTLIKEGNLKRYLLYAIGEILLVMIGISLAFQLNNWNDNRIKKNTETRYYQNIREQIKGDKELIVGQKNHNNHFMVQFKYANEILQNNDRNKMDTLGVIVRNLTQYSDFDRQGNIYETLVNSGEIKILQNHDIVYSIQYLEEKYIYMNRMEDIHYDAMMQHVIIAINPVIAFATNEIKKPDSVFTYEFQNLIIMLLQVMEEKDKTYNEAIKEIERVTTLIDNELDQSDL